MITVVSGIKLLVLIGSGFVFLLGLGWTITELYKTDHFSLSRDIPLILMSGIIFNYGLVLSFQSLQISLIVGCIISLFGVWKLMLHIFYYHRQGRLDSSFINKWTGIAFICLIYLSPIIAKPLSAWDARSIWFFHAKMIYTAGSIGQIAGWQHASVKFSHPDYPKLIPTLAAQIAFILGFWNEYIPKMSLFFMLVPAIAWLFNFSRRSFSFVTLLLLIPFSFGEWIWNGYMDGFLALYFSIAMLLLGSYMISLKSSDFISSICCLISLLYVKNEGSLAAFIGFCIATLIYFKHKKLSFLKSILSDWRIYIVSFIALAPFVLWGVYKQQWHLSNDLGVGTVQFFLRIIDRLTDGSCKLIFESSYQQLAGALMLLGVLCAASFAWNKSLPKESFPALIAALIYYLGIIIIYLGTPYDLAWHLRTSISRTMLPVSGSTFVGIYFILHQIEFHQYLHS